VSDSTVERGEIGRRIKALRRAKDFSIQKLADAVVMSPGYLSEVERGQSAVSGEKLARLAVELGVSADYLLTGRGEQPGGSGVQIPQGLSEAAEVLDLTYAQTVRLLAGKDSLVAKRSTRVEDEWTKEQWLDFYRKVKPYL
jgi:transcriptional regulator with XRE-family HTH domain